MERTIEDSLSELKLDAETFFAKLDKQSEEIRETEKTLQELNINLPFRLLVLSELDLATSTSIKYHLAWEPNPAQVNSRCRLMGIIEQTEGDIAKPLVEIPFIKKMKIIKFLPQFIDAFNKHLNELLKDL